MRRFITIIALLLMTGTTFAQRDSSQSTYEIKTIFGKNKISHGGYGSFGLGYTNIAGQDGFTASGRGVWLIDHSFGLGFAGTGFSNDLYYDHNYGDQTFSLQGGYGGLYLEGIVFPRLPFHISFPVILGVGGVAYTHAYYWDDFDMNMVVEDQDVFLVAEPGVEAELNLVRFIRLSAGVSYRFTSGVNIEGISQKVLNGYAFNVSLKFGKF